MDSSVDLPHPEGPSIETNSPLRICRLMPESACVSISSVRYTRETSFSSINGSMCLVMFGSIQAAINRYSSSIWSTALHSDMSERITRSPLRNPSSTSTALTELRPSRTRTRTAVVPPSSTRNSENRLVAAKDIAGLHGRIDARHTPARDLGLNRDLDRQVQGHFLRPRLGDSRPHASLQTKRFASQTNSCSWMFDFNYDYKLLRAQFRHSADPGDQRFAQLVQALERIASPERTDRHDQARNAEVTVASQRCRSLEAEQPGRGHLDEAPAPALLRQHGRKRSEPPLEVLQPLARHEPAISVACNALERRFGSATDDDRRVGALHRQRVALEAAPVRNSPSCSTCSPLHTFFIAIRYSSKRRSRCANGVPRAAYSSRIQPVPRPSSSRPRLSASIEATCFASRSGFACGRMLIPVPKRSVLVWPAAYAIDDQRVEEALSGFTPNLPSLV